MSENILNSDNVLTEANKSLKVRASLYTIERLLDAQPVTEQTSEGKIIEQAELTLYQASSLETLCMAINLTRIRTNEGTASSMGQIVVDRIAADTMQHTSVGYSFLLRSIEESRGLVAIRTRNNGRRSREMRSEEYTASLLELNHFEEAYFESTHIPNK